MRLDWTAAMLALPEMIVIFVCIYTYIYIIAE